MKLFGPAYVNGMLRGADEGVLHLADDEGERLVDNKLAEDVSADFSKKEHANVPVESLTAAPPAPISPDVLAPVDPQPAPTIPNAPASSAASKE
ncbi:MAG: hypothetical protein M3Y55_11010 [Pseudomonadota bacterium]|nr:hypothetical protein [Pseudomonadota bacterium]